MGLAEGFRFSFLIRFLLLVVFIHANIAETKSFLRGDMAWTALRKPNIDLQPNLTDLLAFRDPNQDPVLKKAMQVIDNLAIQSTCHQAAAAQLLVTCKAVGKDLAGDQGKHELLERAKSVYAVRVAVCETREGRAAVPTACRSVLDIPQRSDRELDVVSGKLLSSCLQVLMVEHYYWTSYSNSRQDANTLCQAGSLEATRLEALRSYEKLAELIPEFREALVSTQSQWLEFTKQQEAAAKNIKQLQQTNRAELNAQHQMELGALHRATSAAKKGLDEVSRAFQQSVAKTGSDIGQTHKALGHILTDFATLRNLLADALQNTAKNNAEVAAVQAKDMQSVHELALATTEVLKDLQESEVTQNVNELFHRIKVQLDQVVSAQTIQLTGAEDHLRLSKELSEAQKTALVWGQQMRDSSASLALEIDSANVVAGRVSSKLDKVNQALTRVEKASSVLTTLSAMLSIPCQFVEHLHLRILALFATPAVVLYFWKPHRYSYSLMAIYVFLETLTSFVTEYHDRISGVIGRLEWLSQDITMRSLHILGQHIPTLVFLCVVLACLAVWTSYRAPRPKVIRLDEGCTVANQYYMEYRVRNGKPLRHPLDRHRRAATVC
ncbi:hypothetical protein A1O3_02329 [Capronia epimyces CBS 606.96]|uniref:Nuclear fusion protein KAR5 n=1 Tax=Capronia epimyces CBS 606.96 TaxID=1182542 RepID=W9Y9Q7_9EURO|nr:uncharacterized protein A1O3_02329 [Capronia epimyces CBS 606.96]EXJ89263.1 hypothetical protein A1O3_02329 [Capronia epimyces CBS 606.96]